MTDARIVRTRAALHSAITELASTKPIPSISVSELATHAGINRVTFYKHFSSPAEVLGSALALDLDSTREHYINSYATHSGDPVEIFVASIDQILDHIDRLRPLYVLSINTPQDGTVPNLLADHFTETITQYLEQRESWEPALPEFDRTVVARFLAHGLVGAIKAWVLSGSRDHDVCLRSVVAAAPAWWFPASA